MSSFRSNAVPNWTTNWTHINQSYPQKTTTNVRETPSLYVINAFVYLCLLNAIYLTVVTVRHATKRPEGKKFARKCNFICAGASVLLCSELTLMFVHIAIFRTRALCAGMYVSNVALGSLVRMIIYVGLWQRQEAVNRNKTDAADARRWRRYLSKFVLFGIVASSVTQTVTLSQWRHTELRGELCSKGQAPAALRQLTPYVFSTWILFQVLLLLLTVLPLVRYVRSSAEVRRSSGRIRTVIVRLSTCAAVCVAVDGVFLVVVRTCSAADEYFNFVPLCYCCNSAIHMYATIFSFANFRERLWPFARKETRSASNSTTAEL